MRKKPVRAIYNADHTAKTCTRCAEMKPFSEFHKDASRKNGIRANCNVCANAMSRRWHRRKRTPEENRKQAAQFRAAHGDAYRSYQRIYHRMWSKANRDKTAAYDRNYKAKRRAADGSGARTETD